MSRTGSISVICAGVLAGACSTGGQAGSELVIEADTIGDTVVVRTVSGSTWRGEARLVPELSIGQVDGDLEYLFGRVNALAVGRDGTIYAVDAQVPELRAYDADGSYLATLGPPGEGPGELKQPDAGLAVLSDGRVLVRDPGNARIQVYTADGEAADTWAIRGGLITSTPFYQTVADEVHAIILLDPEADVRDWRSGLVRYGPDGQPGDTLVPPETGYEAPTLEARTEGGVARNGVPFSPRELWAVHPDGYFLHAVTTDFALTLLRPGGPLRIERSHQPVRVASGERAEEEERVTRSMRRMVPEWRWNGPPIPDVKPPFQQMHMGRDGRIWLRLHTEAREVDDPAYDPSDPESVPDRWREPLAFDVFEPDGTYLGRVTTDVDLQPYPSPVFGDEHVWGVVHDELGVQRIVRFRIELPSTEG
jgi:hypothetical protein